MNSKHTVDIMSDAAMFAAGFTAHNQLKLYMLSIDCHTIHSYTTGENR
jgi:hypothetical protein